MANRRNSNESAPPGRSEAAEGINDIRRPQCASPTQRRRKSDERQREAGLVRVNVWVHADTAREVEALQKVWGFVDRGQAISVAVRLLAKETREGLQQIVL